MTPSSLCLAFIHAAGASTTLPPPNIQELVKQRISHQWVQKFPAHKSLRFDDPNCASLGNYHYTDRSLVLNADDEAWRGPLEVALSSLIEGERLPLERVAGGEDARVQRAQVVEGKDRAHSGANWIPWTLAALGAVAVAYVWIERERHVRELNGLALKF